MYRTRSKIHGKTGGGNIYIDKRWDLLYKIATEQDLPKAAQHRLKWMDHHAKYGNAALTCRYFGVSESCFWKWKKRFEERGLMGLKERSKRPKTVRKPEAPFEVVQDIDRLRKLYPGYGKAKVKVLLTENISESSIGRIISRHQMFYRKRKRKPYSWSWGQKQRIKNLVEHGKPGEHLQMDTVVLHRHSKTYYVKTAIDTVTKIAFAYVYSRNTSPTAVDFLKKLQYVLPYEIKNMHTDNGSEFHGKFEEELRRQDIPHYFSYPHCPKQHGAVERFNRTLQEEFLQEGNFYPDIPFLNQKLMEWLIEYNFHRPHASLNCTNPLAFYDQHFVSLTPTEPSSMYWTSTPDT